MQLLPKRLLPQLQQNLTLSLLQDLQRDLMNNIHSQIRRQRQEAPESTPVVVCESQLDVRLVILWHGVDWEIEVLVDVCINGACDLEDKF